MEGVGIEWGGVGVVNVSRVDWRERVGGGRVGGGRSLGGRSEGVVGGGEGGGGGGVWEVEGGGD